MHTWKMIHEANSEFPMTMMKVYPCFTRFGMSSFRAVLHDRGGDVGLVIGYTALCRKQSLQHQPHIVLLRRPLQSLRTACYWWFPTCQVLIKHSNMFRWFLSGENNIWNREVIPEENSENEGNHRNCVHWCRCASCGSVVENYVAQVEPSGNPNGKTISINFLHISITAYIA